MLFTMIFPTNLSTSSYFYVFIFYILIGNLVTFLNESSTKDY